MKTTKESKISRFRNILVPLDLSEYSLEAVEYACGLSPDSGSKLYLLHVIPIEPPPGFPGVEQHFDTALQMTEEAWLGRLEALVRTKVCSARNIVRVIRRGEPFREIIKFIGDENIGLVVMATHGRKGISHALLGSVAEKVVRHSPVPVLTVKPQAAQEALLKERDVEEQLHLSNVDNNR